MHIGHFEPSSDSTFTIPEPALKNVHRQFKIFLATFCPACVILLWSCDHFSARMRVSANLVEAPPSISAVNLQSRLSVSNSPTSAHPPRTSPHQSPS